MLDTGKRISENKFGILLPLLKILLVESETLGSGIWNKVQGIRNPSKDWTQNPSCTDKDSGIRNPRREIKNPRLFWITLGEIMDMQALHTAVW